MTANNTAEVDAVRKSDTGSSVHPTRTVKFEIYRYDPESGKPPAMQKLEVQLPDTDKMLLDAILRIKSDVDDSLSIRR